MRAMLRTPASTQKVRGDAWGTVVPQLCFNDPLDLFNLSILRTSCVDAREANCSRRGNCREHLHSTNPSIPIPARTMPALAGYAWHRGVFDA